MTVTVADIERAHRRIAPELVVTPFELSRTLSTQTGAELYLKFENHQFTASFKERGALNRLLDLTPDERRRGVIAMSAGNHAQAVAYHGKRLGIPTCIVMPRTTPNAKVEQTRVHGAEILLRGAQFDEARAFAIEEGARRQLTMVHPFDDPAVIAGQGTLGLEMLAQHPELDVLIVPIGGGGLISGVALAAKSMKPTIEIVGVQAERYPAAYEAFHRLPTHVPGGGTVAEGIAVKSPGELTGEMIGRYVDDIVLVDEATLERAMFTLLEIEKTVVEGAGAAAFAAVLRDRERFRDRKVGVVLSGGNVDMMILSSILQRGLVRSHRLVRLRVEIEDVPGALGKLTQLLGELDSNIIDIAQQRTFGSSSARAVVVELVLQMRGEEQGEQVLDALQARGLRAHMDEGEMEKGWEGAKGGGEDG
jgi:threonine dehydratase